MLRSRLCDGSDAYILVKGNITVTNIAVQGQPNNGTKKKVKPKSYPPFVKYIRRTNNTQVHDASYIDVVMPVPNRILKYILNFMAML